MTETAPVPRRKSRVAFVVTLPAAIVLVVGVIGALVFGYHQSREFSQRLHHESLVTDHKTCVSQNRSNKALRDVVTKAFSGTVTLNRSDLAALPPATLRLFAELEPLLALSAHNATVTKSTVESVIPKDQRCVTP